MELSTRPIFVRVIIVGEDMDLIVLLSGLDTTNVYLEKRGRGEADRSLFKVLYRLWTRSLETQLFIHTFSASKTQSLPFG